MLCELASKVEGGCMSACFHMASRARTRAAESYRMAVSSTVFLGGLDWFLEKNLTGFNLILAGFYWSWTGFERGKLTCFYG